MNYVILREFLDKNICDILVENSLKIIEGQVTLGLLDGEDKTNTWYKSSRSPGLSYIYRMSRLVNEYSKLIKKELSSITPIDFSGGINELCLPFCRYSNGGVIKAHRDIDKVNGLDKAVEYNVVCMLTQCGVDFNTIKKEELDKGWMVEDTLFINFNPLRVSKDGKDTSDYGTEFQRFYPNLNKGDVIIFRNDNSIHGVDPIIVKEGQIGRITCGFRSK